MKKAFTLIELLVVIAIIAILAAILFPVFAQAKAAAKKTASLSGVKQMSLAMIQYGSSNGDAFPPQTTLGGKSIEARYTRGGKWVRHWSSLIFDYIKSDAMYNDPLATAFAYPSTADQNFKSLWTQWDTSWGYNSVWLAPVTGSAATGYVVTTKSTGALAQPANTVLMTSAWARSDSTLPYNSYYALVSDASLDTFGYIDPPLCAPIDQYCADNWGKGSFWDTTLLSSKFENGAQTGGVSVRANGGSIVAFADGHAARMTTGAMANGTNWKKDQASSALAMTDESKYIWDDK